MKRGCGEGGEEVRRSTIRAAGWQEPTLPFFRAKRCFEARLKSMKLGVASGGSSAARLSRRLTARISASASNRAWLAVTSTAMITFSAFDTESGWDFVHVYDGPDADSPELRQPLSGNTVPTDVISSSGSSMFLHFTSDASVSAHGFTLAYSCTGDGGTCSSDLAARSAAVTQECCDEPTEDCSNGAPVTCNAGCASVLVPYFTECKAALQQAAGGHDLIKVIQDTVLLCDEPTSGLDSSTALKIIKMLKKEAVEQQSTVICTIHQPSAECFALFDRLLLLQDGHTVY